MLFAGPYCEFHQTLQPLCSEPTSNLSSGVVMQHCLLLAGGQQIPSTLSRNGNTYPLPSGLLEPTQQILATFYSLSLAGGRVRASQLHDHLKLTFSFTFQMHYYPTVEKASYPIKMYAPLHKVELLPDRHYISIKVWLND